MIMVKRERHRYILFKLIREEKIDIKPKAFLKEIWKTIWYYFGMKEANKIGLWLIELNLKENYGIVRCSHLSKEFIITALTLIKEISGERMILSPIKTSGTIKAIKKIKEEIFKKKIN